jgi:sugar/nucleoside kinase (ribokinase family)
MNSKVTVAGAAAVWDNLFTVDHLPERGEIVKVIEMSRDLIPGGCAPNIAVGIAKLNSGNVELYYPVGNDFDQTGLEKKWRQFGINCDMLTHVPKTISGCSWVFMQPDGTTMCFAYPGAAELALPEKIQSFGDWVIVAPVFNDFTKTILEEAIRQNRKIVLTGIGEKEIIPYLPHIDVIIINQHEINTIVNQLGFSNIETFTANIGQTMLYVTKGKEGSQVFWEGKHCLIPIVKEEKISDFTGAGDAYTSGVVSGLIRGFNAEKAGYIGAANASFVVEEMGGQNNLPTWELLTDRLEKQFPGIL